MFLHDLSHNDIWRNVKGIKKIMFNKCQLKTILTCSGMKLALFEGRKTIVNCRLDVSFNYRHSVRRKLMTGKTGSIVQWKIASGEGNKGFQRLVKLSCLFAFLGIVHKKCWTTNWNKWSNFVSEICPKRV